MRRRDLGAAAETLGRVIDQARVGAVTAPARVIARLEGAQTGLAAAADRAAADVRCGGTDAIAALRSRYGPSRAYRDASAQEKVGLLWALARLGGSGTSSDIARLHTGATYLRSVARHLKEMERRGYVRKDGTFIDGGAPYVRWTITADGHQLLQGSN